MSTLVSTGAKSSLMYLQAHISARVSASENTPETLCSLPLSALAADAAVKDGWDILSLRRRGSRPPPCVKVYAAQLSKGRWHLLTQRRVHPPRVKYANEKAGPSLIGKRRASCFSLVPKFASSLKISVRRQLYAPEFLARRRERRKNLPGRLSGSRLIAAD